MITLSDLTILLLGFLVAWYVTDKKDIAVQQPLVAIPEIAQEPKPSVAPNQSKLVPDEWKVFQEEMQRFVGEIGLDKEVFIESAPNEMVISLKDTVPFDSGKADLRQQAVRFSRKSLPWFRVALGCRWKSAVIPITSRSRRRDSLQTGNCRRRAPVA